MKSRPRVIVAGYIVRFPLGGYVWQALHYLLGLAQLGCDVTFYEDSAFYAHAYDPETGHGGPYYDMGLARLDTILTEFGLGGRWVFWDAMRDIHHGMSAGETRELFAGADLFVNLAGVNRLYARPKPPARAFIDLDPGVTQINYDNRSPHIEELLGESNLFFTVGENIGTPRSPLPTGDIHWRPTRPPVVCDLWHGAALGADAAFTTVGRWDAKARDLILRGVRYHWRKSLEWQRFLELPRRTGERFELAMDVPQDDPTLRQAGWRIELPLPLSRDHHIYRRYIESSKGEFSAAKGMNVKLRTGWFSDRSVCYLAAGRPVILQDTGFSDTLPTGRGLFAVGGLDDAVEAADAIVANYDAQSAAARAVARECFDAPRVLRPILEAAGL